jgi:hypothetical protein
MKAAFPSALAALAALAALLLAACAGSSLYRPYEGETGYSEVNIAKNRYEVYFYGPASMDEARATQYAIARAAEIGQSNGFTHFRLASSVTRRDATREVVRESDLFPEHPWTGESLGREERERRYWEEQRRARRTRVTVREKPVARLTVQYRGEDCSDCLSVAQKLREAREQGLIREP